MILNWLVEGKLIYNCSDFKEFNHQSEAHVSGGSQLSLCRQSQSMVEMRIQTMKLLNMVRSHHKYLSLIKRIK